MQTNKTIYIDTLGCAKNEYDSDVLRTALSDIGCVVTDDPETADYLIINTCGFIEKAKVESIDRIFDMTRIKDDHPDKKIIITGCLSERYRDELAAEIPEVDMIFGVNEYDTIPDIISGHREAESSYKLDSLPYRSRNLSNENHYAYLKIAEGCDNSCTFCIIPKIRGHYRSKRIEDVVSEAGDLADQGVKEIILIAQDTSRYGYDLYGESKLAELIHSIDEINEIKWIRLMYVYDSGIDDKLIECIASEPKVCKYIDMPIQHISNAILRRMGRTSTRESIISTIEKLRANIPDVHIRTTLLLGMPGESREDVHELIDFLNEYRIDRVGAFAFSDEEDTVAHDMPGKIEPDICEERRDEIMRTQSSISLELNRSKIGKTYDVIVDEVVHEITGEDVYIGRTMYDAPEVDNSVEFASDVPHRPGDIVPVRITEAYEYDLIGEEMIN